MWEIKSVHSVIATTNFTTCSQLVLERSTLYPKNWIQIVITTTELIRINYTVNVINWHFGVSEILQFSTKFMKCFWDFNTLQLLLQNPSFQYAIYNQPIYWNSCDNKDVMFIFLLMTWKVTIVFTNVDKILLKPLRYNKGYSAKKFQYCKLLFLCQF